MKKMILILLLGLSAMANGKVYRTFTNTEGKTIEASILQYDSQNEKVLLMLRNHNKAWVDLGSLSPEDQEYIKGENGKKETSAEEGKKEESKEQATALSRNEIRDLVQQFIRARERNDYDLWLSMHSEHFAKNYGKQFLGSAYVPSLETLLNNSRIICDLSIESIDDRESLH